MATKNDPKNEIQNKKAETIKAISTLEKRKEALQIEGITFQADLEKWSGYLGQLYIDEPKTAEKVLTDIEKNRQKIMAIQSALMILDKQIVEYRGVMSSLVFEDYKLEKVAFTLCLLEFFEQLKRIGFEFSSIQKKQEEFLSVLSRSGVQYSSSDYPYIEFQMFNYLDGLFNSNFIPTAIKGFEETFEDYFAKARTAAK